MFFKTFVTFTFEYPNAIKANSASTKLSFKITFWVISSLPFKSKIICEAVLLPIPGNLVKYLTSPDSIANTIPAISLVAKILNAVLGPIPLTLINLKNRLFDYSVIKPYKLLISSRT